MTPSTRAGFAALLLCVGLQSQAAPLSANFAVTADSSNGRSFDADVTLSPNEHLTLNAGAGYSGGSDDTADLRGILLDAGASLHGDRGGVSLAFDRFDDTSNYSAATLGARAWIDAGHFEFALLGRQRDMSVSVTLALPLRTLTRDADFSAIGGGLQVTYATDSFSAYIMGLTYDYDDAFDRFLEIASSPQLTKRPRIEALVGSFITQAQGAIDSQAGFGVEYSFGRNALALDAARVHDAILDSDSTSVALTLRRARSAHLDLSVSGGMVDSDQYGSIGFLGVALGLRN